MDSFINLLRYFANNAFQKGKEVEVAEIAPNQEQERVDPKIPEDPPKTKKTKLVQCTSQKPTSNKNLELFIENLEKDLINLKNVKKFRGNITREEKIALKEIRNWDEQAIRIQDKVWRFVILDNSDYEKTARHEIN